MLNKIPTWVKTTVVILLVAAVFGHPIVRFFQECLSSIDKFIPGGK